MSLKIRLKLTNQFIMIIKTVKNNESIGFGWLERDGFAEFSKAKLKRIIAKLATNLQARDNERCRKQHVFIIVH